MEGNEHWLVGQTAAALDASSCSIKFGQVVYDPDLAKKNSVKSPWFLRCPSTVRVMHDYNSNWRVQPQAPLGDVSKGVRT